MSISPGIEIEKFPKLGRPTGTYILTVGDSDKDSPDDLERARLAVLERLRELPGGIANIRYQWTQEIKHAPVGFSVQFPEESESASLKEIQKLPGLTSIIQDVCRTSQPVVPDISGPPNHPQGAPPANNGPNGFPAFNFGVPQADRIVNIYILDNGFNANHEVEFQNPARVDPLVLNPALPVWPTGPEDGGGQDFHGTWVASVAGGNILGVAQGANYRLIDAKLEAVNYFENIIRALGNIIGRAASDPNYHVVNFSGQFPHIPPDPPAPAFPHLQPVHALLTAMVVSFPGRVHVVNAAGNTAINLANEVPPDCFSHHDQVITVGASAGPANPNVRWANSSFGGAVNVFAPGQNIIGARHNNNNQYTGPLSGTSIASPYVAGLVARICMTTANPPATRNAMVTRLEELPQNLLLRFGL